jgi:tetratricopeptide (TPR) repeat protein
MLVAFGKYLKILRDRRKMSLSDVVTLTKSYPEPVGKGYLSRVERGLARVGFSKMVALSRAYEVSLDAMGEKLALDLEVDTLKNAPNSNGKTFAELTDEGVVFNQRGMKWHCYATIRATLSHGTAACGTGRYSLALTEFDYVREHLDVLSHGSVSVVLQQSAVAKRHLGAVAEAFELADQAVEIAKNAPDTKHLGHALETRALLANQTGDHDRSIAVLQEAFAAYKASNSQLDCARTLNNLANSYVSVRRLKAARRSAIAADKLATALGADSIRARSRIHLGEIAVLEGNAKQASVHLHDALEIARRIRDSSNLRSTSAT